MTPRDTDAVIAVYEQKIAALDSWASHLEIRNLDASLIRGEITVYQSIIDALRRKPATPTGWARVRAWFRKGA